MCVLEERYLSGCRGGGNHRRVGRRIVRGRGHVEDRLQGPVIAAAELAETGKCGSLFRQLGAGEHVVDAPPDVALALVAPGRPPGEEAIVVGRELAAQVDQALREDLAEQLALERRGPDLVQLAQL